MCVAVGVTSCHQSAMRLAVLTFVTLILLVAVLFYSTGPGSRSLRPVHDETKPMLGQGPVVFSKPDLGLVSLLRSFVPLARTPKGNPQTRIWVNTRSGLYYCPDSKLYGHIAPGLYMLQASALQHGFQPALTKPCP